MTNLGSRKDVLGKDTREILQEVNYDISLLAYHLSSSFLADVFRSIFNVEKSLELVEPRVYTMDDDPDQIIFERLNTFQLDHLPLALTNDEVLCKNFKLFSDIEFFLFADLSLSMLYRWFLTRDTIARVTRTHEAAAQAKAWIQHTKLYALKYMCCVFLYAAINNAFKINFIPFSSDVLLEKKSHKDLHFPAFVLNYIDEHFLDVYNRVLEDPDYAEESGLVNACIRAGKLGKRSIVLFVSDFLDDLETVKPYLFDLKIRHSLLIIVVNDPYEVAFPAQGLGFRPLNTTWEHAQNIERDIRKRVVLSREHVNAFNSRARARRQRLFTFLRDEKIPYLDLVTDQNETIPAKLESLNLDILQGY